MDVLCAKTKWRTLGRTSKINFKQFEDANEMSNLIVLVLAFSFFSVGLVIK